MAARMAHLYRVLRPFDLRDHLERDLALAHDDRVRAEIAQVLDLGVGMRACDDREARIRAPRLLRDAPRLEGVRDRDHERRRGLRVRGAEDLPARGIALDER